jgi:glycosyltransferase involved in cell wall biosynthesis
VTVANRVAVYVDTYPHTAGGVARMGVLLAQVMAEEGWTLRVVVPGNGPATEFYRAAGVAVDVVPAASALLRYGGVARRGRAALATFAALPSYWWRLHRKFRGVDLVHANDTRGLILAGPAARFARRPLVWQVHSLPGVGRLTGLLARLLGAQVAPVAAAVTPPWAPRRRVHVVRNAVPTAEVVEWTRATRPTVVCVARLHPDKGVDVLVEASARLRARGVDHQVVVVGAAQPGNDTYRRELDQRLASVGSHVQLRGDVPAVAPLLLSADVYVQPSRSEAFGLAILEAMSLGLPVVATRVGGVPELVVDDVTGLLVAPDDPVALADAIGVLLADPQRRAAMGSAGRDRARGEFGVARFRTDVTRLYAAAMSSSRRR